MNKKNDFSQKMHSYLRHPASLIMMILVKLAALITFTVLIFLIIYILVHGVPYLKPSLFSLHYNSENASLMPALINTVIMTLLSLLLAVPIGIFSAIFLAEYAGKGNKFVDIIRLTTETLSGIPSISIWIVRNVVLCKYMPLGIFASGRSIYAGNHDSSSDYAYNGRSASVCSGFVPGRKLWTWSR